MSPNHILKAWTSTILEQILLYLSVNMQAVSAATANTNVTKGSSCAGVVCELYGLIPEVQTYRKVRLPVRVRGTAKVRK